MARAHQATGKRTVGKSERVRRYILNELHRKAVGWPRVDVLWRIQALKTRSRVEQVKE